MNLDDADSPAADVRPERAWPEASPPRYQQVASMLAREIAAGTHPVGSLLPPEPQLCERFGVSRHTLREAVRGLCEQGLLQRRQGVGTVVRAERTPPRPRYLATLGSLQELMQYTRQTRLVCLGWRDRQADAALAAQLRCAVGETWLEIEACRHVVDETSAMGDARAVPAGAPPLDRADVAGTAAQQGSKVGVHAAHASASADDLPLVHMHVYVRPEARGVLDDLERGDAWFFGLIERHGGHRIVEAEQVVGALAMPAKLARILGVRARSPGLRVLRRYQGAHGALLSVSINTYPAERFELATHWRLASRDAGLGA